MAHASTSTSTKRVVVFEEVKVVTLTLSSEEAEALRAITQRVGGSPVRSRRGHIDRIRQALDRAGVELDESDLDNGDRRAVAFVDPDPAC